MSHLYVCHFSNGHIKVGRSIEPKSRIAQHADRLACVGIELSEHHIAACYGPSEPREARLIARCAENAETRHQYEWFVGLDYLSVCEWANEAAALELTDEATVSPWPQIIADLRASGLTQSEIARLTDAPQNNISRLARGETLDPAYTQGKRIVDLHAARCPHNPAQV